MCAHQKSLGKPGPYATTCRALRTIPHLCPGCVRQHESATGRRPACAARPTATLLASFYRSRLVPYLRLVDIKHGRRELVPCYRINQVEHEALNAHGPGGGLRAKANDRGVVDLEGALVRMVDVCRLASQLGSLLLSQTGRRDGV